MKQFFEYINSISPLSKKSEQALNKLFTESSYPAKSNYCEAGIVSKKFGFLKSGIMRTYMVSSRGKEYNKSLFTKGVFFASFTSLIQKAPSLYTIECLTDCTVLSCDYNKFLDLSKSHSDLGKLHRKTIEIIYLNIYNRNIELLTLDATQRYINMQKKIPNIDNLITQKQIANHLAITPVQLSRIRKKLLNL